MVFDVYDFYFEFKDTGKLDVMVTNLCEIDTYI